MTDPMTAIMKRAALFLFALALAAPAGAFAADAPPAATLASTDAAKPIDPNASAPSAIIASYRLGADDKVRVIVYGEDELTGEYSVNSTGKMSLPLVGEVQAAGLTIPELQGEIQQAYMGGYLKDPKVSAEVLNYRPFYILGEVNKPGTYPFENGLTVLKAVATAEGFTYRANTKRVYIKSPSETDEHEFPLTSTTLVAPGDTIRIGERFF